jgi:hypothetical protein
VIGAEEAGEVGKLDTTKVNQKLMASKQLNDDLFMEMPDTFFLSDDTMSSDTVAELTHDARNSLVFRKQLIHTLTQHQNVPPEQDSNSLGLRTKTDRSVDPEPVHAPHSD